MTITIRLADNEQTSTSIEFLARIADSRLDEIEYLNQKVDDLYGLLTVVRKERDERIAVLETQASNLRNTIFELRGQQLMVPRLTEQELVEKLRAEISNPDIIELVKDYGNDNYIPAIKALRDKYNGLGLREAKVIAGVILGRIKDDPE